MNMDMEIEREEEEVRETELFKAAESGDSSIFNSLSSSKLAGFLSLRNEDGRSLLHVAVSSSHPKVVKVLAEADSSGKAVNSTDDEGWAPIHSAASIGNLDIVQTLITAG